MCSKPEVELVRFYLTGTEPVERAIAPVVAKGKQVGARMLIVAGDESRLAAVDRSLWHECPEQFLAHGRSDAPHAERQPVLLSSDCSAPNGATVVAFADGQWRAEGERFERAFLFFDDSQREAVRLVWSSFDDRADVTREYHRLEGGRWRKIL
jgi:DNA polymerase-3 subunit chi